VIDPECSAFVAWALLTTVPAFIAALVWPLALA
jgi:hypothetical protein